MSNNAKVTTLDGHQEYSVGDGNWDDLRVVPGAFTFLGSNDPTPSAWQPGGAGNSFLVYKFNKNDIAYATIQMPHGYKEGSDLCFHIHWTPHDRGAAEGAVNVGWKLDYSITNVGSNFPSSTTLDLSDACSGVDDRHEITSSISVDGSGLTISHVILLGITRTDTGADDTWVGVTAAQSPALLEADIHFQRDSAGSSQELVK